MTNGRPNPVSPVHFAERMKEHWVKKLGNHCSDALCELWRSMATNYGQMLWDIDTYKWKVLPLPTGTGKTQGTALYCAMLHEQNINCDHPPGVLIVSRLITQCDDMVCQINTHAGKRVACAHHSAKPLTWEEMNQAPVLVITHEALLEAFRKVGNGQDGRWSTFYDWSYGKRKLLIIDEALNGMVQHERLTKSRLDNLISIIPTEMKKGYPEAVQALEYLSAELAKKEKEVMEGKRCKMQVLWDGKYTHPSVTGSIDLSPLGQALRSVNVERTLFGHDNLSSNQPFDVMIKEVLASAEAVLNGWCLYAKRGAEHTLNNSVLLLPENAPPAVVLDATARQSEVWNLLADKVSLVEVPDNARSYTNVTLHVARVKGLGKSSMQKKGRARFSRVLPRVKKAIGGAAKALVCVHKDVEPEAILEAPAGFSIAHWGSIDGENRWQDYNAIVICGLSYRDDVWPISTFFATQGVKENGWLEEPCWLSHENILKDVEQWQLSSSIIQAINRIRCRRVSDNKGNCLPTDVYIMLPKGDDGDSLVAAIKQEMPGIQERDWHVLADSPKGQLKAGSCHEAIYTLLADMKTTVPLRWVQGRLKVSKAALKDLRACLKNPDHPLSQALGELGFFYRSNGKTRAQRAELVYCG